MSWTTEAVLSFRSEARRHWAVKRRDFIAVLGGAAAAWPLAAHAQQPAKLPTIGFLGATTPATWSLFVAAFVQRLRGLGWIEGCTIAIESVEVAHLALGVALHARDRHEAPVEPHKPRRRQGRFRQEPAFAFTHHNNAAATAARQAQLQ